MCQELSIPIALDKTEWASLRLVFLKILLDGKTMSLVIPDEKRVRAVSMIQSMLDMKKSKATVKELQSLCGYLNFLNKAVVPGRAFTRRVYAKYSNSIDFSNQGLTTVKSKKFRRVGNAQAGNKALKPHHHVRLDNEFKMDCKMWLAFLTDRDMATVVNKPMIDITDKSYKMIRFYSDASRAEELGFGCIFDRNWIYTQWPQNFVKDCDPSIEFLELFALVSGILTWEEELANVRVIVFCDNMAAVHIVNNTTSSCAQCMKLIRILVLNCMKYNRRVKAKFVSTKNNGITDSLSRLQFQRFRRLAPEMSDELHEIDKRVWPITKFWYS